MPNGVLSAKVVSVKAKLYVLSKFLKLPKLSTLLNIMPVEYNSIMYRKRQCPLIFFIHLKGLCFCISCQHSSESLKGRYLGSGFIRKSHLLKSIYGIVSISNVDQSASFTFGFISICLPSANASIIGSTFFNFFSCHCQIFYN